jgi:hypothetical protein
MNDQYNTLRPSSARSVDALIAAYNAKLKNVQPGTPACQALQSWFTLELNRILGRPPIPLLPDPPPPICGHVPRLAPVPIEHRQGAWDALEQGRVREFLYHAPEGAGLWLVLNNAPLLHALGGYEVALLEAYTGGRTNRRPHQLAQLDERRAAAALWRLRPSAAPGGRGSSARTRPLYALPRRGRGRTRPSRPRAQLDGRPGQGPLVCPALRCGLETA